MKNILRLMIRKHFALALLPIAVVVIGFVFSAAPVLARSVVWSNYDVTLTLNGDGSFHVVERQVVNFEGGPFTFASADIPLTRMDDLTNVEVSEERGSDVITYQRSSSEDPETYDVVTTNSSVGITWYMPRTSGEQRTFVLEYDVIGGLRVYNTDQGQHQQIWWTAISSDVPEIAPIENASFTVRLPAAVDIASVRIDGPGSSDPTEHTADGRVFTWTTANMGPGDSLEGRLEFPALVSTTAPAWQEADDAQRLREQDRDDRQALLKLMMAAAGLLGLTAGGVGLLSLWYTKGRDPGVGAVASYISEPPDDLPPGAAGALVDEYVNQRDIVATLVDLGNRGVLKITEKEGKTFFGGSDFTVALQDQKGELRPFEKTFVTAIMGSTEPGKSVDLSVAKARFGTQVETLKSHMYDELVKRGYFGRSPETTRASYRRSSMIGLGVIIAILVLFGGRIFGYSGWIALPFAAIALVLAVLYAVSRYMPRKSVSGAESAAKWRAFRNYLDDLDDKGAIEGSNAIFQKYLPYAVAFGLEHSWVQKFAQAGAEPPDWFGGTGTGGGWYDTTSGRVRPRRGGWSNWGGWGSFPTSSSGRSSSGGGGGVDLPGLPDVQDASDKGARSLQSLSGGLFDLFESAGSAFESFSGSSGRSSGRHGGFSGGGRSFGGGGGGGHSGGGGGGGSRGFG